MIIYSAMLLSKSGIDFGVKFLNLRQKRSISSFGEGMSYSCNLTDVMHLAPIYSSILLDDL